MGGARRTVLIVDGSSVMRRVIERSLRLAGLDLGRVLEAAETREAFTLARQHHPDLILTELHLVEPGLRAAGMAAVASAVPGLPAGPGAEPAAASPPPPVAVHELVPTPASNGINLLRQLREDSVTSAIPVVVITTEAGESQVTEALNLGARGYIRKPFTADQVKDYIAPLFCTAKAS